MSTIPIAQQTHLQQAIDNHNTARAVLSISPAWATVIAFYSAMHYINAYAVYLGRTIEHHTDRAALMRSRSELHAIEHAYGCLFQLSLIARYNCPPPGHSIHDPSRFLKRVLPWLTAVEKHICSLLPVS